MGSMVKWPNRCIILGYGVGPNATWGPQVGRHLIGLELSVSCVIIHSILDLESLGTWLVIFLPESACMTENHDCRFASLIPLSLCQIDLDGVSINSYAELGRLWQLDRLWEHRLQQLLPVVWLGPFINHIIVSSQNDLEAKTL